MVSAPVPLLAQQETGENGKDHHRRTSHSTQVTGVLIMQKSSSGAAEEDRGGGGGAVAATPERARTQWRMVVKNSGVAVGNRTWPVDYGYGWRLLEKPEIERHVEEIMEKGFTIIPRSIPPALLRRLVLA